MTPHQSAYTTYMPFGKYKGFSLGYINDVNRGYLTWLSETESMPMLWREAAAMVLNGQDLSIKFPTKESFKTTPKATVKSLDKDTLQVKFDYDEQVLAQFKLKIDGRKWNPEEKCWEIPAVHVHKLVEVFGGTKNITADEKTKEIWRQEKKRREELDVIRVKDDAPEITESMLSTGKLKLPLFNYQNVAIQFIERAGGRAMVADQVGMGKTAVTIGYAIRNSFKSLIICQKSTVVQWMREIERFSGKKAVCWSSEGRLGRSDAQFHVINYDVVEKNLIELNKMNFDLLACDEATYLKNRKTKRAKAVLGYYKERKKYPGIKAKSCIFLTGTPVLNRPIEAFSLLNFLDNKRFNNFYNFIQQYGGWKGEIPKNLDDLRERTKDLVIRRTFKQVKNELPEKQRNDLYIELSKEDMKEYDTLLANLFRSWQRVGKPTVAEMPAIQRFLLEKKMPRAIEMIDELLESERGVVVFSIYLEPLHALKKKYGDNAVLIEGSMNSTERQESVDALKSGKAKIGLFSLGAGAMGLDGIQYAIDAAICLSFWWVPAVHEQSEGRIHRRGQKNEVQIFYLVCENTMDEAMRSILSEKQKVIDQIVDGRLMIPERDKSFFKEFVYKLKVQHVKDMMGLNPEDSIEE